MKSVTNGIEKKPLPGHCRPGFVILVKKTETSPGKSVKKGGQRKDQKYLR
jgi:hypothetical protein